MSQENRTKQPQFNMFTCFANLPVELHELIWDKAAENLDLPVYHFNIDIIRDKDRTPQKTDPGYFACFTPSADLIRRSKYHRALLAASWLARHRTIRRLGGQLLPINYIPGREIPTDDSAKAIVKQGLVPFDLRNAVFCINGLPRTPSRQIFRELRRLHEQAPPGDETYRQFGGRHGFCPLGHPVGFFKDGYSTRRDDTRAIENMRGLGALTPLVAHLAISFPPHEGRRCYGQLDTWFVPWWGGVMDGFVVVARAWFPALTTLGVLEHHGDDACLAQDMPRHELARPISGYQRSRYCGRGSRDLWEELNEWHVAQLRDGVKPLSGAEVKGLDRLVNADTESMPRGEDGRAIQGTSAGHPQGNNGDGLHRSMNQGRM